MSPSRYRGRQGRSAAALPSEAWQRLEAILERFEDAWRSGRRPDLDDYLAEIDGERRALLIELAHEDLAYRLRAGEAARVEDYLGRYPELRTDAAVLLDLLADEFLLRQARGEPVSIAEYQARFGDQAAELPRQLALRQAEGNVEAPTLPPPVSPPEPAAKKGPGDAEPAVPPAVAGATGPVASAERPAAERVEVPGYEVLGKLGEGGMGVVYKARQAGLNRVVALKMILHAEHAGEGLRERFAIEAQALARLQHPNVVQIYEVSEHAELPYLALEYCVGGSLEDQLDGTPWPALKAAALVETLARAVHAAHQAKVIHRDLKPANVLLSADGVPKLTDFGLAKRLDEAGRTKSNEFMGTASYIPPEQAGGKSKEVSAAADVYSLGAILYELLTGRPPFQAGNWLDTAMQVLTDEPVAVRRLQPKVPRDAETICHQCLEKGPWKRYASAAALAEDLRRFQAGEPVAARPVGAVGRAVRWSRRRPAVATLLVVVAAAGLGGILWAYGEAVSKGNAAKAAAKQAQLEKERADEQTKQAEQKAAEVLREKGRADDNATKAQQETKKARWQEYLAQIGRADAQLTAHDHAAAASVLERVGQKYRDSWEYDYLRRSTAGTTLTLPGNTAVAYSPDGTRLAGGSLNHSVKVWDARTGAELGAELADESGGTTGQVYAVAFSPNGTRLASASQDNTIKLWDARSRALIATLRGHTREVSSVCYSPDGTRIASASGDGTVKVWDATSGVQIASLPSNPNGANLVIYSPDGTRLAYTAESGGVKVRDSRSLSEVAFLPECRGESYSPDGTRLAGAYSNEVMLWDARSGALLATLRGHTSGVTAVSYSPDGMRIAGAAGNTVRVWDAYSGTELATLNGHTNTVRSLAYSPDGTRLATAADTELKIWDAHSGAAIPALPAYYSFSLTSVACSPDGTRLASASGFPENTVKIWDARIGAGIITLRGHTGEVGSVRYSPDGTRLASASHDSTVKLWDARSGAELATLRGHTSWVFSVAYSPDGTRIASASEDYTVKLWDARSGALIATLRGHTHQVTSVAYSPDGTRLASASMDNTVKVWDASSGAEIVTLHGHTSWVTSVVYSRDSSRIITASRDFTVKIWDARTGKPLSGEPPLPPRAASHVSPAGLRTAFSDAELVRLWLSRPDPGSYDPWAEDLYLRTSVAPAWHGERLAAAERAGDAFAATFHRRRLAEGDNLRLLAWFHLAAGNGPACRQALAMLHQHYRALTALAPAVPLLSVLAAGPAPGLCTAAAGSPLEGERRRLAAQLVRAAAVLPENGVPTEELVALGTTWFFPKNFPDPSAVPTAELVALARAGVEAEPRSWQARELLGAALYRAGKLAEAIEELRKAVQQHGRDGSLWARLFLALAHRDMGHTDQARHYRRQALAAMGWEDGVLQAQLLSQLDDPLPEVLAGRAEPTSPAQALDFARRCGPLKRYAAAARLYTAAFAADPRLMENFYNSGETGGFGYRYNAACFAALAASGQGRDAGGLREPERADLRRLAHDWLRADLQYWAKTLEPDKGQNRNALHDVSHKMRVWQEDPSLAGLRHSQALAALPEAERRSWEQLWADVAALLDRAQKGK